MRKPRSESVSDLGFVHSGGLEAALSGLESEIANVDVVIDTVGGAIETRSLEVLRPGGLLVAVPQPPDAERAAASGRRAEFVFHTSGAARLVWVMSQITDGLRVVVDSQYHLDDVAEALKHLADGHAKGKSSSLDGATRRLDVRQPRYARRRHPGLV